MLPAPKGKKVQAQFINYLKNTAQIPKNKRSVSKQNKLPHQQNNQKQLRKEQKKPQSRVIQLDFSRISTSYVLQGNVLKKKQIYDPKHIHSPTHLQDKENQIMKNRKQILKLQYLQKMGVIKPEEQAILKKYRKLNPKAVKRVQDQNQLNHAKIHQQGKQFQDYSYYQHPSSKKVDYYSPKNMVNPKNLSGFFSPKHDNMHGYNHYHYGKIN